MNRQFPIGSPRPAAHDRDAGRCPAAAPVRPRQGTGLAARSLRLAAVLVLVLAVAGCAKYNTWFNAKRAFDRAEHVREDALRKHQDLGTPSGTQRADYDTAIRKAQKILDEYPGHSLTDDVLFLQGKARHRLESYRMSIRTFDLLFTNYPATEYMEEALYLQALNYLLLGAVQRSQEYLDQLARAFPESRFQAETRKVSGDNAYSLEEWEEAAVSYRAYLEQDVDQEERDRVSLRLAECYWETESYAEADRLLATMAEQTDSAELAFRARLLQARVQTRQGRFTESAGLLEALRGEASIYDADGEVTLYEAENLVAEGRGDEAAPLLQNMPEAWLTPVVKAKVADVLGRHHLEHGEWEQARTQFLSAVTQSRELDDEDETRRLESSLADYLAAEQSLPDAKAEQVPRLKLLQANAMLFGFDRPARAADLYLAAAADTAADSTLAARALYGAYVTYERHLDHPDSAALMSELLLSRYPDSPQAFEVGAGTDGELIDFLLARRDEAQREAFAALTDDEKEALATFSADDLIAGSGGRRGGADVRRRMVYLSRRDNILFPPLERAQPDVQRSGPVAADAPGPGPTPTADGGAMAVPEATAGAAVDSTAAAAAQADAAKKPDGGEDKKDEKKKRELEENWDFLR